LVDTKEIIYVTQNRYKSLHQQMVITTRYSLTEMY